MSSKGFARSGKSSAFRSSAFAADSSMKSSTGFLSNVSPLSYLAETPDLTTVDPGVVVPLKSLVMKKDDATKVRSLNEVTEHIHCHAFGGDADQALLEAWVKLYPRLAIDNSNRSRELAHSLQYELMLWAGKRMEKKLPYIVGPWLAGAFDRYKPASKAVTTGLSSFLNTPEKKATFWQKCQPQILDYAIETLQETPDAISDNSERTSKPDEARAKYLRAVGGAAALAAQLVETVDETQREQFNDKYDRFFNLQQLWDLATVEDSMVRKAVYRLVSFCLDNNQSTVESLLPRLRQSIVGEGLRCDQSGSATEFVLLLTKMTTLHPDIWTAPEKELKSVKHPLPLAKFIEKGSQGGTGLFWSCLNKLLAVVPLDQSRETATCLANAVKTGLSNRTESHANYVEGWVCYIELVQRFVEQLKEDGGTLTNDLLLPLLSTYVFGNLAARSADVQLSVAIQAHKSVAGSLGSDVLTNTWKELGDVMKSRIAQSTAAQPTKQQQSQKALADAGVRWMTIVGAILRDDLHPQAVIQPTKLVVAACCEELDTHNFQPNGVAAILKTTLAKCPSLLDTTLVLMIVKLIRYNVHRIIGSPSSSHLFSCINALGNSPNPEARDVYEQFWPEIVESVLQQQGPEVKGIILKLISNDESTSELARSHTKLQEYILRQCITFTEADSWSLFETATTFSAFSDETQLKIAISLTQNLDPEANSGGEVLQAIEMISERRPDIIVENEALHMALLTKLMSMASLSDQRVSSIKKFLSESKSSDNRPATISVIQANLCSATHYSLDVNILAEQALSLLKSGTASLQSLLPDVNVWMQDLMHFLRIDPSPTGVVLDTLGGAVSLISQSGKHGIKTNNRDKHGAASPARMALYSTILLQSGQDMSSIPLELQVKLAYLILLTNQAACEQEMLMSADGLWASLSNPDAMVEADDFFLRVDTFLNDLTRSEWAPASLLDELVKTLAAGSKHFEPRNLYTARALTGIFQRYTQNHKTISNLDSYINKLDVLKPTEDSVLGAAAVLRGFNGKLHDVKEIGVYCNKVVSGLLNTAAEGRKILIDLVLLDAAASVFDTYAAPVANNRVVFVVKSITSWLEEPKSIDAALATEICHVLQKLLAWMPAVYGDYWADTISFVVHLLERAKDEPVDKRLGYVHAALNLETTLDSLVGENDDLEDAMKESEQQRDLAALRLLGAPREQAGVGNSPLSIVEYMVCQRTEKVKLKYVVDEVDSLYALLAVPSSKIQRRAWDMLRQAVPEKISQISVDVVLDKSEAKLPENLIAQLRNPPSVAEFDEDQLSGFPARTKAYLLAWAVVFTAFDAASHKVKEDFTTQLKVEDVVSGLFDFVFDVLGHSMGIPLGLETINLDSANIVSYDMAAADSKPPEHSMSWLATHVVYLALVQVPRLFRTWHIDCRRKQTKMAVRGWVEKYLSPLILARAFDDVEAWAANQDEPSTGESKLRVKVNRAANEVVAGYEVDETEAQMCIKIAEDFPLGGVQVQGVQRVAASEKKWQSWMMVCQGVITFSNGSIIDGLIVFRKNIVGALKGHVECAICFCLVSEDSRMPDKRCGTCKNAFHKWCLYKWMQSSSQSTCPLCRNPID